MANLKDFVYLSNEDFETLATTGTVTINGETLTYDPEHNVYVTPEQTATTTEDGLMSASDKSSLDIIKSAYLKNASVSNNTLTITKQDNSTVTFQGGGGDEIFWATYGTTTFAQIQQAISDGKEVLCKYDFDGSHNTIYSSCSLLSGVGYYFSTTYGNRTRAIIICKTDSTWSNSRSNFVSGTKVDNVDVIDNNDGIGKIKTINGDYNASTNKLATASDLSDFLTKSTPETISSDKTIANANKILFGGAEGDGYISAYPSSEECPGSSIRFVADYMRFNGSVGFSDAVSLNAIKRYASGDNYELNVPNMGSWTGNKTIVTSINGTNADANGNISLNLPGAQTAYTNAGSSTKVPQITTNTLGQVTNITEVDTDLSTDNLIRKNAVYSLMSLSTVAGSATSGSVKSVRWYVSGVNGYTAPYDGMKLAIKVPLAGVGTGGIILSINGDSDADYHPVAYNVNSVLTTHYPVNTVKIFTYDASQTMTCYKSSGTAVTVTGVWKGESNYDSNTTTTYGTLDYYFRPYVGANRLTRYKIVALDKDNRIIPITTEQYVGDYGASTTYAKDEIVYSSGKYYKSLQASNKGHAPASNATWWSDLGATLNFTPNTTAFRPEKLWFYNTTTTIAANSVIGGQILVEVGYSTAGCTYNFTGGVPAYRLIYLKGTYDKTTGLFTLDTTNSTSYFTLVPDNVANLTLSSYFASDKDYILVGAAYSSANYFQLFINNAMYHFDGTNLVPYDTYNDNRIENSIPTESTVSGWGFTKNQGTVKSVNNTSPDANGNVSLTLPTGNVTGSSLTSGDIITGNGGSAIAASAKKIGTSSTTWDNTSDVYVPTMKAISNKKLDKITYEWNKAANFGSSGFLKIGSFPMYDTNVTIDIDATTGNTYHGTVVIATQNTTASSLGSVHKAEVYDDPSGTIASSLRIVWTSGSRNFDVYFVPQAWSKNLIHIRATGLNSAPDESTICVSQTGTVPTTTEGITITNILDSKTAASGGTAKSLVTTGEKYTWNNKQSALATQTAYTSKGTSTKVPTITTNSLGQVTAITETAIDFSSHNTTYTFNEGSTNGAFSVTPSGGSAQSVSIHGLGAAAYKGTTNSVDSESSDLITSSGVYTAINNLPKPMMFKGTVGVNGSITWDNFPAAAPNNEGWMYKVTTAHTSTPPVCKVGDSVISNGMDWVVIPSGDEEGTDDTWRAVNVNGNPFLGNAISTSAVNFKNGVNTTVTASGNDIQIDNNITITNTSTTKSISDGTNTFTFGSNAFNSTAIPTTADYVSKKANTTLNSGITTTWDTYGTRKITVSGNSITLDMSADTGGWAGTFASFKDAISTSAMLGFYGTGSSGLSYAYMFGAYNDPAFKVTKDGYATFKNKLTLTGGIASGSYSISIPTVSSNNETFALHSEIPTAYIVSATLSNNNNTLTLTDKDGNTYSLTNSTYSVPNNATTSGVTVNNASSNGFWYITSGGTYTPPFKQVDNATGNDYRVLTTAYSTSWYQQIATDFRSNDIFVRRNQNGALQPWTALVKLQPCSGTTTQTMPTITDNAIARFDTSRNATIQNSNVTIDDNGNIAGAGTINGYTLAAASAKGVDTSISTGSTSTNLPTSAAVASFVEGKGYGTGTITSVKVGGTTVATSGEAEIKTANNNYNASTNKLITQNDIQDMVTCGGGLPTNEIVVGANNDLSCTSSGAKIATSSTTWSDSSDVYVPTMKRIKDAGFVKTSGVTSVATGTGLTGGTITGTGTIKANLNSESSIGTIGSNKVYAVGVDTNGKLAVSVPWEGGSDTNYYPTAMSWTNGTTSGPTATITMSGTSNISVGAIPAANGTTQSGIVTTGDQTFGGIKTFETSLKIHTPANQTDYGNELTTEIGADFINVTDHTNNETWRFILPNLQDEDEQTLATMGNINSITCVKYTSQTLTTAQKSQARTNIGAGTLSSVKSLNTNNTAAQTASSSESLSGSGTINLHKVSKTGKYSDLNDKPLFKFQHNVTITISGNSTNGNGTVGFSYLSTTDSAITDIDETLSELSGEHSDSVLPASGFLFTLSNKYVVVNVSSNQGLRVKVHNISNGNGSILTYETRTGTYLVTDTVSEIDYY